MLTYLNINQAQLFFILKKRIKTQTFFSKSTFDCVSESILLQLYICNVQCISNSNLLHKIYIPSNH